jgi:5-methylcytosine-specific restriction enzyme A
MQRSADLMTVGCFLSRYGSVRTDGKSAPPDEVGTSTWTDAYLCFFRSLSGGRSIRQFGHALKNTRDEFDGFFSNGRVGWRSTGPERDARPLTPDMQIVFNRCAALHRSDHWALITAHHSLAWSRIDASDVGISDCEADATDEEIISRTEGGRKVVVSSRVERNPKLRAQAIELHGAKCTGCGFDFQEAYGSWGAGFCEVHHLSPLGEQTEGRLRLTNPLHDLAVVCANCHRMIHRRRGTTLSIAELRAKLRRRFGIVH